MAHHGPSLKRTCFVPRYREAYPHLDIGQAKEAFERGNSICEFTDRSDGPLGLARFDLQGDRCQFEYTLRTPFYGYLNSSTKFELTPILNGIAKGRLTIKCPGCETHKKILFLKDKWRCASCHELSFRSQLIHPLAKKWETFDWLSNRLEYGKPHGMHNKTYILLLKKLEERKEKLCGKPRRFASSKFSEAVEALWRSPLPEEDYSTHSMRVEAESDNKYLPPAVKGQPLLGPCSPNYDLARQLRLDYETEDLNEM